MSNLISANFKRSFCAMCWGDHSPLITYDETKPVNSRHGIDMKKVAEFYDPFNISHARFVYQCFGREEAVDLKKLLLPWMLDDLGKVDFWKKNQVYFDITKKFLGYFKATGVKVILSPFNGCENNMQSRLKWSPYLLSNNINGIDGLNDPKAKAVLGQYMDWWLELDDENIEWQAFNEPDESNLPLIQVWADKCKAKGIPAERLHYSVCIDLKDDWQSSPAISPHHKELMIWRETLGHPAEDIMDRWIHGLQVKLDLWSRILSRFGNWVVIPSTDGRKRKEIVTPAWAAGQVKAMLERFGKTKLQLGPVYKNKLHIGGFEHMITSQGDVAVFEAVAKVVEEFFDEKIPPKPKYIPDPDPIIPPPPVDPIIPPSPGKPPFDWKGELANNKKWIFAGIGLIVLILAIIFIL